MPQDSAITFRAEKHNTKFSLRIILLVIVSICLLMPTMSFGASTKKTAVKSFSSSQPIVSLVTTPSGAGYWVAARDGGVFTSGDAQFYGSAGGIRLNKPIVGMASTPNGGGYWLVASDGGIFAYGNADFFGSTGGQRLNKPIVGMASTASGRGYWLVASDGGVFTFGDAQFYGSAGGQRLNKPIVGMTSTKTGRGYWLVASDGGIFAYGNADFYGSTGGIKLLQPVVGIARTPNGNGYTLAAADGGIFTFGDADFYGSLGGGCQGSPTVSVDRAKNGAGYYTMTADGQIAFFTPGGRSSCPPPPANACVGNTVSKRVIVSIDEQHLWLCQGGNIYAESDVTTGAENNGHGTPTGNFAVYSKQRDTFLTGPGYRSHVNYWMPFIRGYGLHDASWRRVFGAGTYASVGSHGCVNMPVSFTPTVYNWVNVGTQVTIKR